MHNLITLASNVRAGTEFRVVVVAGASCRSRSLIVCMAMSPPQCHPNETRHHTVSEAHSLHRVPQGAASACELAGAGVGGGGSAQEGRLEPWVLIPPAPPQGLARDLGVLTSLLCTFVSRAWNLEGRGQWSGHLDGSDL